MFPIKAEDAKTCGFVSQQPELTLLTLASHSLAEMIFSSALNLLSKNTWKREFNIHQLQASSPVILKNHYIPSLLLSWPIAW